MPALTNVSVVAVPPASTREQPPDVTGILTYEQPSASTREQPPDVSSSGVCSDDT